MAAKQAGEQTGSVQKIIAENELLGAAKSIENAAKKLAALKPRREIKGKVRRREISFFLGALNKFVFNPVCFTF